MGTIGSLFPFCTFRAWCSITAPAVLLLSKLCLIFDKCIFKCLSACFVNVYSQTDLWTLRLWILNCIIPNFHIADDSLCNKAEWTILKVVFLVFVLPVVATSNLAKNRYMFWVHHLLCVSTFVKCCYHCTIISGSLFLWVQLKWGSCMWFCLCTGLSHSYIYACGKGW